MTPSGASPGEEWRPGPIDQFGPAGRRLTASSADRPSRERDTGSRQPGGGDEGHRFACRPEPPLGDTGDAGPEPHREMGAEKKSGPGG